MTYLIESPLDDMDTAVLYQLLGDAWYAQFKPIKGESYCLESSLLIGKREFAAVVPLLRSTVKPPDRDSVVTSVASTIRNGGLWRMPAYVVAALAAREGV